jgi:hypothetical protein
MNITEIIGNRKYVGSIDTNLNTRVVLEQPNKLIYENNLFFDISQAAQFNLEKNQTQTFRLYGKIDPIFCFDVYNKTTAGDRKITLDKGVFDFNSNNWSVVILRSVPTQIKNASGMDVNIKGVKTINNRKTDGTTKFYLDLSSGLPAKTYFNGIKAKNLSLFFPLGHNFNVGDKVMIKSANINLNSGIYNVIEIGLNKIIIDHPTNYKLILNQNIQQQNVTTPRVVALNSIVSGSTGGINKELNDIPTYMVRNIKLNTNDVGDIINKVRPKIYPFIESEYTVSKVIEKEQLEYYIKTLEVVDTIDEIDDCGFSINNYNNVIKNWISNKDIKLSDYRNNSNEPLSELYIGIIKNSSTNSDYSNVESHFSQYIEFVESDDGIEQISNNNKPGQKVKVGDRFFHSVCEYSTEQLTETEICYFKHRLIHRDVLFYYNPFYKKKIKLKSDYIENSDNITTKPDYAVFSRKEQKWIWRDFYDIGVADENGDTIDYPFTNGSFYVHSDIKFFLFSEKRLTKKYDLNTNDITSKDGNKYINELTDVLDNLGLETNLTIEKIKPFNKYQDKRC